ncbi:hypothetical protein GYMLUDRAFT_197523 [Collybiopsis luxurians FD-317 M1]|uniref:Molybdopterin synthase sulfur carrier subunit n=1 Tax=Collybiopsis luxurians FD-317 M1 TaxID=944289 RepID=A0A0D0CJV0_9AGAR|nr:hypothetical protein GYMLUDRAFT_197523 [Collybiopsis luxurians FD-317 M1]
MSASANIKVLYFAAASTTVGLTEELVPIPAQGFYLASLADLLVERHSNLSGNERGDQLRKVLDSSQWSVDAEMVDNEDLARVELRDGMEIAVICPVSGG